MIGSSLYMVRELMRQPLAGYNADTHDFDGVGLCMIMDKNQTLTYKGAKNKKNCKIEEVAKLRKYRQPDNRPFRIKWYDYAQDWMPQMSGDLAKAWTAKMFQTGFLVSLGDVHVMNEILQNRNDIINASKAEKAVLAEPHDTMNVARLTSNQLFQIKMEEIKRAREEAAEAERREIAKIKSDERKAIACAAMRSNERVAMEMTYNRQVAKGLYSHPPSVTGLDEAQYADARLVALQRENMMLKDQVDNLTRLREKEIFQRA